MKTNLVRIILRVTPEEGQSFSDAALRDDRELHHWILRTLRTASGGVSAPSPVPQVVVKPAPVVPKPRPAPVPWVNPALPGSPCEHMYSPPAPPDEDSAYDCPQKESFEEYTEKLRKGDIKLEGPSAEELDKLEKMRAIGAAMDTN